MIIDIPKLKPEGEWFRGEEPPELLELKGPRWAQADRPIRYELFAQVVSSELIVKGIVAADIRLECGRCVEFFSTTVTDDDFLQGYDISGGVETVDVTGDIREAVLLSVPHYPVCQPDCKGLCPQCGRNLNTGSCACRPASPGGRWGALDGLKLT
jgi:uncharacterized protein